MIYAPPKIDQETLKEAIPKRNTFQDNISKLKAARSMRLEQESALTKQNSLIEIKQQTFAVAIFEDTKEQIRGVFEDIDNAQLIEKPINHEFKISKRHRNKKVVSQLTDKIDQFTNREGIFKNESDISVKNDR